MEKWLLVLLILAITATPSFAVEKDTDKVKRVDTLIAVFDLEVSGKVDKDMARPLSDSIRREVMISSKYEVVDRSNMDKILKEQSFQMTGCTTKDCAVEAGQMLGVGKIVVGSLSMVGKMYYLSLSLVNVQTGKTEAVEEDQCMCAVEELIDSSKRVANKLMGAAGSESKPLVTQVRNNQRSEAALQILPPKKDVAVEPAKQEKPKIRVGKEGLYVGLSEVAARIKYKIEIPLGLGPNIDDSDSASVSVARVGYGFNRYFSLEFARYTTINIGLSAYNESAKLGMSVLDGRFNYPLIGNRVELYALLGYAQNYMESQSFTVTDAYKDTTYGLRFGAGVDFYLSSWLSVNIDLIRNNVSSTAGLGLIKISDVTLTEAGLTAHF